MSKRWNKKQRKHMRSIPKRPVEQKIKIYDDYDGRVLYELTQKEITEYQRLDAIRERRRQQQTKKVESWVSPKARLLAEKQRLDKLPIFRPPRAARLSGFRSKESYNEHMKKLRQYSNVKFFDIRTNQYKENMITAIKLEFGAAENVQELIRLISSLTTDRFQWLILQDPELFSIDFVYTGDGSIEEKIRTMIKSVERAKSLSLKELGYSEDDTGVSKIDPEYKFKIGAGEDLIFKDKHDYATKQVDAQVEYEMAMTGESRHYNQYILKGEFENYDNYEEYLTKKNIIDPVYLAEKSRIYGEAAAEYEKHGFKKMYSHKR